MPSATLSPTLCVKLHDAEHEFMEAMEQYKRRSRRMFPTWCEVLEVLCNLGYEKPADRLRP